MPTLLPLSAVHLSAIRQNAVRFAHWRSNSHFAEALAGETAIYVLIKVTDNNAFRKRRKEQPPDRQPDGSDREDRRHD